MNAGDILSMAKVKTGAPLPSFNVGDPHRNLKVVGLRVIHKLEQRWLLAAHRKWTGAVSPMQDRPRQQRPSKRLRA